MGRCLRSADEQPDVGYIRIFFYLNGFSLMNGNLKTVPGSHLFRTDVGGGQTDEDIMEWADDKTHPVTGEPLAIRKLECPEGSVVKIQLLHSMRLQQPAVRFFSCRTHSRK